MNYVNVFLALAVAFLVTFISTPFVKTIAAKIGAVDIPKDDRRMHREPIPRLGGLAMFYGFMVSVLCFVNFNGPVRGIIIGALIIAGLGVIDDIKPVPAWIKFSVQLTVAFIVVYNGLIIRFLTVPKLFNPQGFIIFPEYLAFIISVLWIVGITNAVNLIDGLDGLAVGVSSIASLSILGIALLHPNFSENALMALLSAALFGSCLGFLPFNFNPAKIFMGDTGSTFLGFILATMSIQGLFKGFAIISFLIPFLILGLPIFDTGFAIIRRIIKGKPIMTADRGHLHHRLIDMGFSHKQTVAILYSISSLLGLSAVVMSNSGTLKAMILIVAVMLFVALGIYFESVPMPEDNDEDKQINAEKDDKDE